MRALLPLVLIATPVLAEPMRLDLRLTFEPAALAELQRRRELVTVAAYFSGEPVPAGGYPVNPVGLVDLGREEITFFPGDRTLLLGQSLDAAPTGAVVEPYVNVNVFTARMTDGANLIDCGFLDAPVAVVTAAPQPLHCTLISP